MNIIIQPVHLLIYTALIGGAITFATTNYIYTIMVITMLFPIEKFIKELFGLDKAPHNASGFDTALKFAGAQSLLEKGMNAGKQLLGGGKGKGGSEGGESSEGGGNVRFQKSPNDIYDTLRKHSSGRGSDNSTLSPGGSSDDTLASQDDSLYGTADPSLKRLSDEDAAALEEQNEQEEREERKKELEERKEELEKHLDLISGKSLSGLDEYRDRKELSDINKELNQIKTDEMLDEMREDMENEFEPIEFASLDSADTTGSDLADADDGAIGPIGNLNGANGNIGQDDQYNTGLSGNTPNKKFSIRDYAAARARYYKDRTLDAGKRTGKAIKDGITTKEGRRKIYRAVGKATGEGVKLGSRLFFGGLGFTLGAVQAAGDGDLSDIGVKALGGLMVGDNIGRNIGNKTVGAAEKVFGSTKQSKLNKYDKDIYMYGAKEAERKYNERLQKLEFNEYKDNKANKLRARDTYRKIMANAAGAGQAKPNITEDDVLKAQFDYSTYGVDSGYADNLIAQEVRQTGRISDDPNDYNYLMMRAAGVGTSMSDDVIKDDKKYAPQFNAIATSVGSPEMAKQIMLQTAMAKGLGRTEAARQGLDESVVTAWGGGIPGGSASGGGPAMASQNPAQLPQGNGGGRNGRQSAKQTQRANNHRYDPNRGRANPVKPINNGPNQNNTISGSGSSNTRSTSTTRQAPPPPDTSTIKALEQKAANARKNMNVMEAEKYELQAQAEKVKQVMKSNNTKEYIDAKNALQRKQGVIKERQANGKAQGDYTKQEKELLNRAAKLRAEGKESSNRYARNIEHFVDNNLRTRSKQERQALKAEHDAKNNTNNNNVETTNNVNNVDNSNNTGDTGNNNK